MNKEIIQQLVKEMQGVFLESFDEVVKADDYAEFNKKYVKASVAIIQKALGEMYTYLDKYIKESEWRKKEKYIVKDKVRKTILTSIGYIKYDKTIYTDKKGKTVSLIDEYVGIKAKEQMMDDARERIIEEVIDSSYRKAGIVASIIDSVSKGTVKEVIKRSEVPEEKQIEKRKKEIEVLYIEADEDHVSMQDKREGKNNGKTIIDKLVYCFEGKESEAPISKRRMLIKPHYFGGIYSGSKGNEKLWEEVYEYIDREYEIDKIKKIYISGDGAAWIKEGVNYFKQAEFVMDEYHILKYAKMATGILKDSQDDGIQSIYDAIIKKDKEGLKKIFKRIMNISENESEKKQIKVCEKYFINNIESISLRLEGGEKILGCSAEGHVSHILSRRLSSRPMGWSNEGCDKITKLIVYHKNGGEISKLFKRTRKINYDIINYNEIKKESKEIIKKEYETKRKIGASSKYYELTQATIDQEIRNKYKINY